MLDKAKALLLVKKYIKTENTVKHMLALEAIMQALGKKLEPAKEKEYAMAGLVHDLDYEQDLGENYKLHGTKSVEILKSEKADLSEEVYQAIKAHCYNLNPNYKPKNLMDWSIFISDSLTGLIVATALVRPSKKLADVEIKSIKKKFKEKSFAAGTRREDIKLCEEKLGIPFDEFLGLSLKAMQEIAPELGL